MSKWVGALIFQITQHLLWTTDLSIEKSRMEKPRKESCSNFIVSLFDWSISNWIVYFYIPLILSFAPQRFVFLFFFFSRGNAIFLDRTCQLLILFLNISTWIWYFPPWVLEVIDWPSPRLARSVSKFLSVPSSRSFLLQQTSSSNLVTKPRNFHFSLSNHVSYLSFAA